MTINYCDQILNYTESTNFNKDFNADDSVYIDTHNYVNVFWIVLHLVQVLKNVRE